MCCVLVLRGILKLNSKADFNLQRTRPATNGGLSGIRPPQLTGTREVRGERREGTPEYELQPGLRDGNATGPSPTAGREQQEAQAAQAELVTVRRQEGDTAERLHQCGEEKQMAERNAERLTMQLDQCNAEKQTVERNIELLTAQFAELRQGRKTADERAAIAEEEVRRLTSALSHQKEEAELQHYRALAVQQEKWEVREKSLEQQLQETMARKCPTY